MRNGYVTVEHVRQIMALFDLYPEPKGHTLTFLANNSGLSPSIVHRVMRDVAPEAFVQIDVRRFGLSGVIPEGIHPDLHRPPLNLPPKKPKREWEWNADALSYLDGLIGVPTFRDLITTLDNKDLKELSIIGKTIAHAADEKLRTGESSVPSKS